MEVRVERRDEDNRLGVSAPLQEDRSKVVLQILDNIIRHEVPVWGERDQECREGGLRGAVQPHTNERET